MTSRVRVPFQGEGAGTGDLTWAQLMIWQTMQESGRSMNIGGTVAMPAGTPVEAMVRTLRFLVSRHPALRTRLRFDPGGPPRQVVSGSGEAVFEIVDVDDRGDTADAAEELRGRYALVAFDYADEWPIRMGAVRCDGSVSHLVVMYCHLAVDGFGIDQIVRDLAHLDPVTGEATAPVSGLTALELAARQHTPAGLRQSQKSLRFWEQQLLAMPGQRFGASGDPREPRFWELTIRSPAMHLAMQRIAHRTGVGVGHVVLAAYALALSRVTGGSTVATQLVVSNRFRPGCADSVSMLVQNGICVIDVAGAGFDDLVGRAWNAATNAYLHGYYDPSARTDLLARIREERAEVDISCLVNDRRAGAAPAAPPTAEQVAAAVPRTTTWWSRKLDTLSYTLIVNVDAAPDAVDVAVLADTHRIAPAGIEAFAREMETVLVVAAGAVQVIDEFGPARR
ncbi:condensation domain-containing protein [Dactylosporangium sp. NPDC049525]|uniref:condensation domain-containing protein n=1 Tax=Dactylosporangium sp. NPDC049525 TaxID=3154730 RepID=UPI00343BA837